MTETAPEIPVGVVIPAAGSGERLGGQRKQFRLLGGKPLLVQTVSAFQSHDDVSSIVVVAPSDAIGQVTAFCKDHDLGKVLAVVVGGQTRQDSVRIGVDALPDDTAIVITHDAVRPFIEADEISRLIGLVTLSGAASAAVSITDTLCRTDGGLAGESVSRDGLFRMLTPQGFRREVLLDAHEKADRLYTDEVTLVRAAGYDVTLMEASPINIKLTTQADWDLAEWMWPAWRQR